MATTAITREEEVQDTSSVTEGMDVAALDIVAAAESLLQLSEEEDSGSSCNKRRKLEAYRDGEMEEDEEGSNHSEQSITSRMIIEEIFGKEEDQEEGGGPGGGRCDGEGEEVDDEIEYHEVRVSPVRKRKPKKKLRSLGSLYKVTEPLKTTR